MSETFEAVELYMIEFFIEKWDILQEEYYYELGK